MRIGLLSEFVYPFHNGGAEKRFYEVATRLARRGHEVHWYGMQDWEGPPSFNFEGVELHAAGPSTNVYGEDGSRSIAAALRTSMALASSVRRSGVALDVIDCSLYPFFHIAAMRVLRARVPLAVTWHEFWGSYWYEYLGRVGFFGKVTESFTARMPQRIIAISDFARDGLLAAGVNPDRVVTIYNGVDTTRLGAIAPSPVQSDIVFFGRLKNHKNVDLLLHAISIVRRSRPDVYLLVLGDGPEHDRLIQLRDDLGLTDNVDFRGELGENEMLGLVAASRISVNPSTKEGGGSITLLEANALGVPVVAVRHPFGIDEGLIEPGRTGWWAAAAEPPVLAAALLTALADSRPGGEIRRACQSFVKPFDWNRITDQYESVYRGLETRMVGYTDD